MTTDFQQKSKCYCLSNHVMTLLAAPFRREEILDVLKRCFYVIKQKNVPIFYATSKDLRDFTTTEKDMKKGIGRFPTPNYRNYDEDLSVEGSIMSTANSSGETETGMFQSSTSGEADVAA